MQRQSVLILSVSWICYLTSAQVNYNPYAFLDTSLNRFTPFGSYNFQYPTNRFFPQAGIPRPINSLTPYSYFRRINATTSPSDQKWNPDEPAKNISIEKSDVNIISNDEKQKELNDLNDESYSWNQMSSYLRNGDSQAAYPQVLNMPPVIQKSSDNSKTVYLSEYPYNTQNTQFLNGDSQRINSDYLRAGNPNYPVYSGTPNTIVSPILKDKSKSENCPEGTSCNEISDSVLYYYKDPCDGTDFPTKSVVLPYQEPTSGKPIDGSHADSLLGSIVSPYLTRNNNFKNFHYPTESEIGTIKTKKVNLISLRDYPPLTQQSKSDINSQDFKSGVESYYPYSYQNLKSDETNSVTTSNEIREKENVYSFNEGPILETRYPDYYYHVGSIPVREINVKLSPYLIQRTSLNYLPNLDPDKRSYPLSGYYTETQNPVLPTNPAKDASIDSSNGKIIVSPSTVMKRSSSNGIQNQFLSQMIKGGIDQIFRQQPSGDYMPNSNGYQNYNPGNFGGYNQPLGGEYDGYYQNSGYNRRWPY